MVDIMVLMFIIACRKWDIYFAGVTCIRRHLAIGVRTNVGYDARGGGAFDSFSNMNT